MPDGAKNSPGGQGNIEALQARVSDLESQMLDLRNKMEQLLKAPVVAPRAPVVVEPKTASPAPEEDQSRLVAILTAAAMAIVGRSVVVRRITFINQNTVSGWAEAGRQSIHYSHNIRR